MPRHLAAGAASIAPFIFWLRWYHGADAWMPPLVAWALLGSSLAFATYAAWPQWARLKRFRRRLRFQNPIILQSPIAFDHDDGRWRFYPLCGDGQEHVIARRSFFTKALDADAYPYYADLPQTDQRLSSEVVFHEGGH